MVRGVAALSGKAVKVRKVRQAVVAILSVLYFGDLILFPHLWTQLTVAYVAACAEALVVGEVIARYKGTPGLGGEKQTKLQRRRGISTIFGFMIVVVIFTAVVVPFATYAFITLPFQQMRAEYNQLDVRLQASEESLTIQAGNAGNGTLFLNATNSGGLPVQVVSLFTTSVSGQLTVKNGLSKTANVGGVIQLNTGVDCADATPGKPCTSEVVTSRGRTFSEFFPPPSSGGFASSNTTKGIGSLEFDFDNFYYYTGPCPTTTYPIGCPVSQAGRAWYITGSANNYVAFSIKITNVDEHKRVLVIGSNSYLEAAAMNVARGGGKSLAYVYQIGSVAGGAVMPFSSISLGYGQTTTIYYVSMLTGNPTDKNAPSGSLPVTPLFLIFTGTIGGLSWGENFPFTSIYWAS